MPANTPFAGYPNWITAEQYVRIKVGNSQTCVKNVQLSTASINTPNYLKCDGDSNNCLYDDVANCVNTTPPPPTTTTLPPKPCKYDISASLAWSNGLDLDIYVKTNAADNGGCSADGDNTVYWGNKNYTGPYESNYADHLAQKELNHDAYPSCNEIDGEIPPEKVSGSFTEPRTFWIWWNRHSICTENSPDVAAQPTDFVKTIKITNNIE